MSSNTPVIKRHLTGNYVNTQVGETNVVAVEEGTGLPLHYCNHVMLNHNGHGYEIFFMQLDALTISNETKTIDARIVSKIFLENDIGEALGNAFAESIKTSSNWIQSREGKNDETDTE